MLTFKTKHQLTIALAGGFAGAKKDEKSYVGARVIFFVIGGMTYSEVRSAYELTKSNNREVTFCIRLFVYQTCPAQAAECPTFVCFSIAFSHGALTLLRRFRLLSVRRTFTRPRSSSNPLPPSALEVSPLYSPVLAHHLFELLNCSVFPQLLSWHSSSCVQSFQRPCFINKTFPSQCTMLQICVLACGQLQRLGLDGWCRTLKPLSSSETVRATTILGNLGLPNKCSEQTF
jgi:hypothetical protein